MIETELVVGFFIILFIVQVWFMPEIVERKVKHAMASYWEDEE